MSTVAAKKPPVTGRDPNSTPASTTPSRATPRSATPGSTPAGPTHGRTRSFRTGTPVSARAAAGQRRESLAPPANNGATQSVEEEEAARGEKVAMLDDLKDRLAKAETASDDYRKQAEVLQARLDESTQEQVKYEEKCHEHEEQIEGLQNEMREATRKIRELEGIYETEHSAMVKDKEEMANREEELQMVIARLKDSLNQQKLTTEDETRSARSRKSTMPFFSPFWPARGTRLTPNVQPTQMEAVSPRPHPSNEAIRGTNPS